MSGNLAGKVYEMQMLKQRYGINSSNAHAFMHSEAAYDQLRSKVDHALKPEGIKLQLSWQEISNLCEDTALVVKDALNEAHFRHFGNFHYFEVSDFNDALLTDRKIPWARYSPGTPGLYTLIDDYKDVTFQFDYARFLQTFARTQKQGHDKQEAFRQAFLIFKDSAEPFLTSPKGEPLSYPRFVETIFTYGKKKPIEEITSDPDMIARTANTLAISRQLVEDFKEWQMAGSENYVHGNVRFNRTTPEERKFLYGFSNKDDPYERAILEKTDKRLGTERSIALHYILGDYELEGERAAIIKNVVEDLTRARDRRRERYESLRKAKAPESIVEKGKVHFEKTQYTLNAIRKNKGWLEDILSK